MQGLWDEGKELDSAEPLELALCECLCESSKPRRTEVEFPQCF